MNNHEVCLKIEQKQVEEESKLRQRIHNLEVALITTKELYYNKCFNTNIPKPPLTSKEFDSFINKVLYD